MGAMCRQELNSPTAQVFALLFLLWVLSRFQGPEQTRTVTSSLGAGAIAGCHFPPAPVPFLFGLAGLKENVVYVCILCWDLKSGHTMCSTMQHPKKNTISIKMGMLMSKFVLKNLILIQNLIIVFMSKFVFPAQSLSNLLNSCSRL